MATPYGDAVAADNPTVWWRFAESSGTTANDSGATGNYDGTHTGATAGATALTDDDSDAAVSYDGIDDFTAAGNIDPPTGGDIDTYPYTLECIIQTTSAAEMVAMGLVRHDNETYFRELAIDDGVAYMFTGVQNGSEAPSLSGGSGLNDGKRHHLVGVWKSATERYLYVDGVLVDGSDAEESAGSAVGNSASLTVGCRRRRFGTLTPLPPSKFFAGIIDEVAVYSDAALTAERVAAHAAAMTADAPEPPTATGLPSRKFIVRPCVRPVMYPCVRPCVGG